MSAPLMFSDPACPAISAVIVWIDGTASIIAFKLSAAELTSAASFAAVAFAIADGQLPSNTKAGYVIRRILRRAIRYGYSFLEIKKPFIYNLVSVLCNQLGNQYIELSAQKELIENVIKEEEESFLRTIEGGLKRINQITVPKNREISGKLVFELYDTFGFPSDLTALILNEKNMKYSQKEFDDEMNKQKEQT